MEIPSTTIAAEGHLKWLYDLAPFIQKSAKSENETLQSYCARLLRVNESENGYGSAEEENEDDDNGNQDQQVGGSWKEKATLLAKMLNRTAMLVLVGDNFTATSVLEQADTILNRLFDTSDIQCQLIKQCRDALRCKIGEGHGAEGLNRIWEELTTANCEAQATVYFLQGMLGVDLKIDEDKITELYMQASDLDPTCLLWCHHVYRSIRRNRGKGGNLGGPSEKEMSVVMRAYHLCEGQDPVIALDFGLLLKEKLWARKQNEKFWRENHEIYLRCVDVLENAEKISKGTWKLKSKLYLAEFLYFGKAPDQDRKRGREMLLELEQDFPNSFSVLHKVGNMYRAEKDFKRAQECYHAALKMKPGVMPCIMDYIKLLKTKGDRYQIIKILDKALSPENVRSDKDQEILEKELERIRQPKKKTKYGTFSEADMDNDWRQ